jgi:hypothetical protein
MKKFISLLLIAAFALQFQSCMGARKSGNSDSDFYPGASVRITLHTGKIHQGVILRSEENMIKYVDSETHRIEDLKMDQIRSVRPSDQIFDFEGNVISEKEVANRKGMAFTAGYGVGGAVLGGAVGFGVGILLAASNSVPFIYPMGLLGIGGAYLFGRQGSEIDWEDAVENIRRERYEVAKKEREEQLKKQREELEKEKSEKEEMLKKLRDKSVN